MTKKFSLNPRALPLLLGLMLIGGTACFSMQSTSPEELARIQAQQQEQQRMHREKLEHDASTGDPVAITSLANLYLFGINGVPRDTAKGIELLERAVAASYPAAQVELGWILLAGQTNRAGGKAEGLQGMRDPDRGMTLLKESLARTTCAPHGHARSANITGYSDIGAENAISEIYRAGKFVHQDLEQANLWLERSLVHCQYPSAPMLANSERYGVAAGPGGKLAWLLLLPSSPQLEAARGTASPDDMRAAEEKAVKLRQAVLQSETQYPAPH